jgi:RNA polymerase sigma-70 factor (ECF subfamily)
MSTHTDDEWLRALRSPGGSSGVEELRRYVRRGLERALAGRALRREDLDDFTHDAVVRVIENLERFRGESRFGTWAMAIAVRVAFTALRRRRHPVSAWAPLENGFIEAVPARATPESDPTRRLERKALLDVLSEAIGDRLTPRQRTAVLGELEGIATEELAARLGIARNALYKLHHDARRKLREAILEAGFTVDDVREELDRASEE